MRKYFAVARITFKAQVVYRFDVIMTAMGTMWRVVFAWILWGAIFALREDVGGFTIRTMLTYYVISAFFVAMDVSDGVSAEVSTRIKEGTFSKFMVVPANPQLHFLSQTFGTCGYYAAFSLLAAMVGTVIFRIRLVVTTNPVNLLLTVAVFLVGVAFMNGYQFFLGLWAFKFQEIGFMLHVLPNIASFLKGEMVPLSLLPPVLVGGLRFLPFTHVVYTPTMLLMGEMEWSEGLVGLAVLAVWTVVMAAVGQLAYRGLRVKYEGVGI